MTQENHWIDVLWPTIYASGETVVNLPGTTAMILPIGDTSDRASSPINGMMRYNTDLSDFEVYNGAWAVLATSAAVILSKIEDGDGDTEILVENFTGADDDTIAFTMGDNSGTYTIPAAVLEWSTAGFGIVTPSGNASNTGVGFTVTTGNGNIAADGGGIGFIAGTGGATGGGGGLTLTAGDGGSTSGAGGEITLSAGVTRAASAATGTNGEITVGFGIDITSGSSYGTGYSAPGGDINITTGYGGIYGGSINLTGGNANGNRYGGSVNLIGGTGGTTVGYGHGGTIFLRGGDQGAGVAGPVFVQGGRAAVSGAGGTVTVIGGAAAGAGADGGDIILAGAGSSGTGGTGGDALLRSGSSTSGAFDAGSVSIVGGDANGGTGDGGDITIQAGQTVGGSTGAIVIPSQTVPTVTTDKLYNDGGTITWNGIDLTASGAAASDLATTGADVNIDLAAPPTIGQFLIATSATTATWQDVGAASDLATTGADVNIDAAIPPTAGQSLVATSATTATWQTVAGAGDVVKVGTPVNNQIGVWTGDGTMEGDSDFTWDGTTLTVNGDIALNGNIAAELGFEIQTGLTYGPGAFTSAHSGKMVTMDNASPNTVTLPSNASLAYPIGTEIHFQQLGAGTTTIAIDTDTLNVNGNLLLALNGQYAVATALKMTATTWTLFGNLVPI